MSKRGTSWWWGREREGTRRREQGPLSNQAIRANDFGAVRAHVGPSHLILPVIESPSFATVNVAGFPRQPTGYYKQGFLRINKAHPKSQQFSFRSKPTTRTASCAMMQSSRQKRAPSSSTWSRILMSTPSTPGSPSRGSRLALISRARQKISRSRRSRH